MKPMAQSQFKRLVRELSPWPKEGISVDNLIPGAREYLPIVPSSRLWLPRLGKGDDARFAENFRDTWRRIPLNARRAMVGHWRKSQPLSAIQMVWSPLICLCNEWELSDETWRQPKDAGVCGHNGHTLYFYAPLVDAMPPQHVGELIAHELAHVVQYANGEIDFRVGRPIDRNYDDTENYADDIMEDWGFDSVAMDKWCRENWIWPAE